MRTQGLILVIVMGLVALVLANWKSGRTLVQAVSDPSRTKEDPQRRPMTVVDADDDGPSRAELYREAQRLDIAGRSRMSKNQLEAAVRRLN